MITQFLSDNSSLKLLHVNLRSLTKNFDKLHQLICDMDFLPDVIGISETKLNDSKDVPALNNYDFLNINSRTNSGGVGFYIKSQLSYAQFLEYSLNCDNTEDIWIKLYIKNTTMILGLIYRHPQYDILDFTEKMTNSLQSINDSNLSYVIMGDFNIDLTSVGNG